MYDVQGVENNAAKATWVPRLALKRVPESLEEASLKKYEAIWVQQIRRQRAADERKRKFRDNEKSCYYNFGLMMSESEDQSYSNQVRESGQKLLGNWIRIT